MSPGTLLRDFQVGNQGSASGSSTGAAAAAAAGAAVGVTSSVAGPGTPTSVQAYSMSMALPAVPSALPALASASAG